MSSKLLVSQLPHATPDSAFVSARRSQVLVLLSDHLPEKEVGSYLSSDAFLSQLSPDSELQTLLRQPILAVAELDTLLPTHAFAVCLSACTTRFRFFADKLFTLDNFRVWELRAWAPRTLSVEQRCKKSFDACVPCFHQFSSMAICPNFGVCQCSHDKRTVKHASSLRRAAEQLVRDNGCSLEVAAALVASS